MLSHPCSLGFCGYLLAVLLFIFSCGQADHDAILRVTKVVDGDTIHLSDGSKVRYIGMDTPEVKGHQPDFRRMAAEATEANRRLVEGKSIHLEFDVERRDRYGRLLAYVYAGDVFVNAELVRLGYATVYTVPPNVRHSDLFLRQQREARDSTRGLWAQGDIEIATRRSSAADKSDPAGGK